METLTSSTPSVSSTPSTTSVAPTTPSAAPATSAPPSAPTPAERPRTLTEAFARDAAAPPAAPDASTDTAATGLASESGSETVPPGPIPFAAHKTALENARVKAREAVQAEFDQQYGWAKQGSPELLQQGIELGRLFTQDRAGFVRQVMQEALTDPSMAPLIRSEAARVLGQRVAPQPPPPDLSPDIPVMDAHGQVVAQTFSADRVQQIVQQAVAQALEREVAPLKQDYQTRQQAEQARQMQEAVQTASRDIYTEAVETLPGFKEHEAAIAKRFEALPVSLPADRALRQAWKDVVGHTLAPMDRVKADTLKELQTKAAASAATPTPTAVPTSRRPTSLLDPGLSWG